MTLSANPPDSHVTIRCPRLGHEISFSYCRAENSGLPCFKALDCWHPYFDVHALLKAKLSEADFSRIFEQAARPKVLSLLDLIEQAKKGKDDRT